MLNDNYSTRCAIGVMYSVLNFTFSVLISLGGTLGRLFQQAWGRIRHILLLSWRYTFAEPRTHRGQLQYIHYIHHLSLILVTTNFKTVDDKFLSVTLFVQPFEVISLQDFGIGGRESTEPWYQLMYQVQPTRSSHWGKIRVLYVCLVSTLSW